MINRMTNKEATENLKGQIKCLKCETGIDCEKCRPNWSKEKDIEALNKGIEALEQEPCNDCISRTQAIKAMDKLENEDIEAYGCSIPECFDGERARLAICLLPSIQPKPKIGHWTVYAELTGEWEGVKKYACDKCGEKVGVFKSKYCPNCGAKMEGE